MQIVRTIIWVLLLVALFLFSIANWDPTVTVRIWDGLVLDTKIPAIVVVAFLIGFVPMWLYYRAAKWQLKRKVSSLESAVRTAAATPIAADPEPEVAEVLDDPVAAPEPDLATRDDDDTPPSPSSPPSPRW